MSVQNHALAAIDPQAFGDGGDELPVGDGSADRLGDRFSRQQGALLMAAWTKATLLAGEGDEHLVAAVRAPNAGKAEVQVAAAEEFTYHVADDQSPRAVAFRVTLVIGTLEFRIVTLDGLVERRLPRPARAVDGCDLRRQADHGIAAFRFEAGREQRLSRHSRQDMLSSQHSMHLPSQR